MEYRKLPHGEKQISVIGMGFLVIPGGDPGKEKIG